MHGAQQLTVVCHAPGCARPLFAAVGRAEQKPAGVAFLHRHRNRCETPVDRGQRESRVARLPKAPPPSPLPPVLTGHVLSLLPY